MVSVSMVVIAVVAWLVGYADAQTVWLSVLLLSVMIESQCECGSHTPE